MRGHSKKIVIIKVACQCKMLNSICLFMQTFSINIRSINANVDNLLEYLRTFEIEPSVIVLTETWHNDSTEFHGIEGCQGFF